MDFEKIQNKERELHLFEKIALILYILIEINIELFVHRTYYTISVALLIISYIYSSGLKFKSKAYLCWIIYWAGITAFSLFYSIKVAYTVTALLIIISRGTAIYFIIQMIDYKEQLVSLLKIFINVATLNLLYILRKINVTALGVRRLGAGTIESDVTWGANFIGTILALAVAAIIILLQYNQFTKKEKILACIQLFLCVTVTLLCGSRIALFILLGIPMLTFLYMSDVKILWYRVLIIVFIISSVYYLIMQTPQLYDVLGSRVERLILSLQGKSVIDGSINSRHRLIEYGLDWFKERPLLGYGMYTFMELSGHYFAYFWYAHNNYIEILVGTGIVGFVFYYWYYLYIIFKCVTMHLNNNKFIIPLMIVLFIGEFGVVAFKSFAFQFLIGVITILINISNQAIFCNNQNNCKDCLQKIDNN